jgi:hypothetical protein
MAGGNYTNRKTDARQCRRAICAKANRRPTATLLQMVQRARHPDLAT